jgi:hypothetical protein
VLRGLPAEERAAGPAAALDHALHDRGDPRRLDLPRREVVEEEQRLGAGAGDVVGAHRDEVDPDGGQPVGSARDLELGADAVGGGGQEPPLPDPVETGEAADAVGDLRPTDVGREVGDQGDGLRRGLGVDAGVAVRAAHDALTGS